MAFLSLLKAALLLTPLNGFSSRPVSLGTRYFIPSKTIASIAPSNGCFPPSPHRYRRVYSSTSLSAKPKSGSVVENYQTVSVNCNKCGTRLFRYKKKNGTKSNLVKLYVERISEDCTGLLEENKTTMDSATTHIDPTTVWECPNCHTNFARSAIIHGRPALKRVGGKIRMTKK